MNFESTFPGPHPNKNLGTRIGEIGFKWKLWKFWDSLAVVLESSRHWKIHKDTNREHFVYDMPNDVESEAFYRIVCEKNLPLANICFRSLLSCSFILASEQCHLRSVKSSLLKISFVPCLLLITTSLHVLLYSVLDHPHKDHPHK